jgi:hypothetical protein
VVKVDEMRVEGGFFHNRFFTCAKEKIKRKAEGSRKITEM